MSGSSSTARRRVNEHETGARQEHPDVVGGRGRASGHVDDHGWPLYLRCTRAVRRRHHILRDSLVIVLIVFNRNATHLKRAARDPKAHDPVLAKLEPRFGCSLLAPWCSVPLGS